MTEQPVTFIGCVAKVFELWETDYRANPDSYLSKEESDAIGVSELSADRAAYFCKLWEDLNNSKEN